MYTNACAFVRHAAFLFPYSLVCLAGLEVVAWLFHVLYVAMVVVAAAATPPPPLSPSLGIYGVISRLHI